MRCKINLIILFSIAHLSLCGQGLSDLLASPECDLEEYEQDWTLVLGQSNNFSFSELLELETKLIESKSDCANKESLTGLIRLNIYSLIYSDPQLTLDEKLDLADEVEQSIEAIQYLSKIDSANLSTLYFYKSAIHKEKREYRDAEKYALESLNYEPDFCSSLSFEANSLMQIGSFSGLKENLIDCEKYFRKFKNLNGLFYSNKMKLFLSRFHTLQEEQDSSLFYLNKVDDKFIQEYEYIFLISQIEYLNKFNETEKEEQAILRKIEITFPGSSKLIDEHLALAECYITKRDFKEALYYHNSARDSNLTQELLIYDENFQLDIDIQALKIKLNQERKVDKEDCNKIRNKILNRFNQLNTQKGKLELLGRLSDFYTLLIKHNDLIGYSKTELIGLQENSRAFTLFNEIKNNESLKSFLGEEKYAILNSYKERIQAIDLSNNKQNLVDEEKVKLKIEKNILFAKIDSIKQDFSNYSYTQDNNYSQKLGRDESLISYYVLDSSICVTIINKDSIFLERIVFNSENQSNLDEFKKCISIKDYCSLPDVKMISQKIFNLLVKPFEALLNENLIIIPHGPLSSIPFEALFDSEAYLVERKNISYSYSINLFNNPSPNKNYFNKLLAIAPSYSSVIPNYQFDSLNYNTDEVETIGEYFYFKTLLKGKSSTKSIFLSELSKPNIVHIAGHADIDPVDSDYSFIAFNDSSGEIDSSLLFLSELYSNELDLDMLVLSACNTGIGKYKSGEGILSLTRGFLYAGVKSIISSLWQMEEKASADLLDYFYHHLSKGHAKHRALTLAKRDYLEIKTGDHLHPFYWSGFVVIGDCSPMFVKPYIKYSLGILLLLIILLFSRRSLKKRNNFVSEI